MSSLNIRPMTALDIPSTLALRTSTNENRVTLAQLEAEHDVTPETLEGALLSNAKGWVCEEQGQVVGFAMGDRRNGEVTVVAVRPGFEKRGIGRALLGQVSDWLFSLGYAEVWLYSNSDPNIRAYGFYRHLGWVRRASAPRGEEVLVLTSPTTMQIPEGFLDLATSSPFNATSGPYHCRLEDDSLVLGLLVEEKHCNSSGQLHGAMMCALADNALSHNVALCVAVENGVALESLSRGVPDVRKSTVSLTTDFINTVGVGSWVEARARVHKLGGRLAFASGTLTHGDDILSRYNAVFRVFRAAQKNEKPA